MKIKQAKFKDTDSFYDWSIPDFHIEFIRKLVKQQIDSIDLQIRNLNRDRNLCLRLLEDTDIQQEVPQ